MAAKITSEKLPQRTLWIDACRGIAILLVLLGHNNPPFIKLIYGFHMPLFFILSGYIYKDKHTNLTAVEEILALIKGYIIPYLIFGFLNLGLHLIHLRVVVPDYVFTKELILGYVKGILTVDTNAMPCCYPMWFLPAFAVTMLIFYIIRNLPRQDLRVLMFIILAIISVFACNNRTFPVNLQAVVPGILLVEIGYLLEHVDFIRKHILNRSLGESKILYVIKLAGVIALSAVLGLAGIYLNPVSPRVDMSCGTFGNFPLFFLGGIFASLVVMLIVILLGTISNYLIKPFAFIGVHTVFIMSFDASTNSWGGTILMNKFGSSYSPPWYQAYAVRLALMAGYLLIWLIILKIIPPLKKLTHS